MCVSLCSFCNKSASKLVRHHLCDCCLVDLECSKAGPRNREHSIEKVACEICLENFPEDELKEHQNLCTARLVFRCSVCNGDYVSKEGLWNHLDQHEIADESKDLYYQEMRATYKLFKCVLCNDQRGYQETIYWRHVHEDHDGFFLRCLDCGTNFRSEKLATAHALNHCNGKVQMKTAVSTSLELNKIFSKIVLPKLEFLQKKHSDPSIQKPVGTEMFTKNCEQKSLIQPEKSDMCKKSDNQKKLDPQTSKHPPTGNCNGDIIEGDNSLPSLQKTSVVPTNERSTFVADENPPCDSFKVSDKKQDQPDGTSNVTLQVTTNSGDYKCTYCGKECHDKKYLSRHYFACHKPTECKLCKKTFKGSATYSYHKLMSHTEPRHKCPICQRSFHKKTVYQRHLSQHQKTRAKKITQKEIPSEESSPVYHLQTYKAVPLYAINSTPQIVYFEMQK